MSALEGMLKEHFPSELNNPALFAVKQVGSQDLAQTDMPNTLALYLYRLGVDPTVPGGVRRAQSTGTGASTPRIPVMLHFLMIAIADSAFAENIMMGWAFQQLAITPVLNADRLKAEAPALPGRNAHSLDWDDADDVRIATEELTREELMRIWDTLPRKYSLTVPYVARGVRLDLAPEIRAYSPVVDRTISMERIA
jgi:hypothetical protein